MQTSVWSPAAVPSTSIVSLAPFQGQMKGRVFSVYFQKTFSFQSDFEMVKGMKDLFDCIDFPQVEFQQRSFFEKRAKQIVRKAEDTLDCGLEEELDKQKSTFIVNVLYRKNATWQGSITWVDQNRTQNFRSALEMLELMEQASRGGEEVVSWEK